LRRVLLVRGARRRRHQERGLPHRPLRGGERAAAAPGGRRGRGRGRAGYAPRPHRQGLRRAEGGARPLPRARRRARRRGQDARRPPSVPARDRAPRRATQDGDRQDPALPAPAATMTDLGVGAKLRAAFELSPTILAVTALDDGRLIEVNDAFLRTTGYTREEIIGRPIPHVRLWVDPSLRERGLADLRAGSPVRGMEARFRTKSGEEIVAIANADLVDVDGQTCVLTALVDITARVRAEAALETLARAKDEFLAMLGHELRNPLAAITNALAVLDRLVADAEVRRVTGIIDRQTAHLSRLVDDLLDVARVTSGKIELRP